MWKKLSLHPNSIKRIVTWRWEGCYCFLICNSKVARSAHTRSVQLPLEQHSLQGLGGLKNRKIRRKYLGLTHLTLTSPYAFLKCSVWLFTHRKENKKQSRPFSLYWLTKCSTIEKMSCGPPECPTQVCPIFYLQPACLHPQGQKA